jgi:glycosyltransferase involved in cell wall biosynthesis
MISLVITTLNEERTSGYLLEDILSQTRKPDELIIVDGGSRDHTVEIIEMYRQRLEQVGIRLILQILPGANIAQGRNRAISMVQSSYIAVTDAGCRLDQYWLERIVEPLVSGKADFVGGFFQSLAYSRFQKVLAALTTATYPTRNFLPSSRSVAFTKSIWERVGGYPERLPSAEDTEYDRLCLDSGARYEIVANAVVYWEVRPNFRSALKQYFYYSYGDGLATRFSHSHLMLQFVYWCSLVAAIAWNPWALILIFLYPLAWMLYRRAAGIVDLPLAYTVALGTQLVRFIGFILGILAKGLQKSKLK